MKADSSTMQLKRESRSTFISPLLTAFAVAQLVVVGFILVHGAPSAGEACVGVRFSFNKTYTPFGADSLFTPTLAFGSFSFSTAKTIDIIWDLFVGRGGQAILIYIAYRVFTRSLVFSMESRPTPYQVFAAIAFDTVSISTIHILGKECVAPWQRTRRCTLTVVGLILASSYILAFPTLISALTGYDATYRPYVNVTDGSMIPFSSFETVDWVVWDGSRIGLADGALIVEDSSSSFYPLRNISSSIARYKRNYNESNYYDSSQGLRPSNGSSNFTLGKTTYYLDRPYLSIDELVDTLVYQDQNYSKSFVADNGVCQPGKTYRWGFSSQILFFFSISHVLWICVMWTIWGDARKNSHVARQGYTIGTYRAVVDLSKAIRHETGEDCDVLSEKDLQSRLHNSGNGMVFQRSAVDSLDIGVELNQLLPDNEANKNTDQSTTSSLYDGRWM
ncbi:hypothetical protein W97_02119 [Coniosporium apollinis CBS 100218]|uniref:Uncharacterized protein n=1 Tax=Coniosporium apollinis (strain CBS 100218) TaxID=1168221 RepID=R7YM43_CONA1|nr:uncharacterized protein W97_02119 [Coniosporium apollinis CBS 100218]EON62894.1 hypothetical protein W97_02119 [Coniosporium apollinis CBS 100218]